MFCTCSPVETQIMSHQLEIGILLPSAGHLEERPTVSQSASQPGKQSVRQPGRHAGKGHSLAFLQLQTTITNIREPLDPGVQEQSVVEWSNTRQTNRLASVRIPAGDLLIAGSANRAPQPSFILDLGSNPSEHTLLTPLQPPPPKKNGIQFQGDRGLRIKKSIGGSFCWAK